jgi:hypothetical protein
VISPVQTGITFASVPRSVSDRRQTPIYEESPLMRIRTLVPALACLAAAPLAIAADGTSVKFDGFVDSIWQSASADSDAAGESGSNSNFVYGVKLGVAATISEKVSAQVDIYYDSANDAVIAKQAYGMWKITDDVSIKTGKFIGDIGWVSAYAPGLYRINGGPIPGKLYSTDSVGADVIWAKDAVTVSLTVANGLFDTNEVNGVGQSDVGQGNEKYAYLADVTFALPDGKGSVNGEVALDTDVTGKGGDVMHLGINTTLTPTEPLTLGGELIYQSWGVPDASSADDTTKLGALAMANFKLGSAMPIPASVTGMVQYLDIDDGTNTDTTVELSLALLTNPAGTDKLGMNFEVNYTSNEVDNGTTVSTDTIGVAAELLYVF